MKNLSFITIAFLFALLCFGQTIPSEESTPDSTLHVKVNWNIINTDTDYFQPIIENWKTYLTELDYMSLDSPYWFYDGMTYPDYPYLTLCLLLKGFYEADKRIQCTVMGVVPVQNDYYLLKTQFSHHDKETDSTEIYLIQSVYAKKDGGTYKFMSSTQYFKEIYENKKLGTINYIIHPEHQFDEAEALKMTRFNKRMADFFEVPLLGVDYFVANNMADVHKMAGKDFCYSSYQPSQTGGYADSYNNIIYAGNNSSYYPHELVHLYAHDRFPSHNYHAWISEGVAVFLGGSTGYELAWHIQKLKIFFEENPDFDSCKLIEMEGFIPNGEYSTLFKYVIGGFLIQELYEKEGKQGIFEALESGDTEEDFYAFINKKMNLKKHQIGSYILEELNKIPTIPNDDLGQFKY